MPETQPNKSDTKKIYRSRSLKGANKDILKMQDKISKYLLSINFSKTHIPNDFMHFSGNTYYRIKNNKITKFKYHTGYRDFIDTAVWTLKEFIKYKKISDLK